MTNKLIWLLLVMTSAVKAQQTITAFERNDELVVYNELGLPYAMPTAGGMNYITAGAIDLNLDGTDDLVLFDRTGDKAIPLVWDNSPGNEGYHFDFSYANLLPPAKYFMQLRDYNCDGKKDVFAFRDGGFELYKNTSTEQTGLSFEYVTSAVMSFYNPGTLPAYVIPVDVPAIEDMDGDGDLDLMSFGILGTCIEYHRNYAQEELGRCDTLVLKLETDNWGKFTESLSTNQVNLNDSCDLFGGRLSEPIRHAGSSMVAFDADGDNDKDLLLGDISYRTMVMLTNGGTNTNALVTDQQVPWPANTAFVNISIFPAASFVDIDHDGNRDMVVSANNEGNSETLRCLHYYHNIASDNAPQFEYIKNTLFVENMPDFGEGSYPAFCDINNDGLKDLVVGNYGYYQNDGSYKPQLAYFENVGSASSPEFTLITRDYAGLSTLGGNALNYCPTFGDVDGDGDEDMLVGTSDGRIFYFENVALPGAVANFIFQTADFQSIDVGTFAAPQLVDVDQDNLPDLLVGETNGKIHYFRNTGTLQNMQLVEMNDFWGGVNAALPGEPNGFSMPVLFRKSGVSYLITGSQSGKFKLYSGIDGNLDGAFILEDSLLLGGRYGERSAMALYDINGDSYPDAIIGNYSGGISYYQGIFPSFSAAAGYELPQLKIIPNPGRNSSIYSSEAHFHSYTLMDLSGRVISSKSFAPTSFIQISEELPADGLYLVRAETSRGPVTLKWIVK
ncbi:MAG: T9SS type A sorting domain-containing protein [Bacteroidetes bacterium]|nr:T9SS type A sorting domain-containing protein [Bacteroidota bacterium]